MTDLVALPIHRPVATTMFFLAVVILGLVGWSRIPVELLPALQGDQLFVSFSRQGSEPEVVEREILLPLEAAAEALGGVQETTGRIEGASGTMTVRFDSGTNHRVRELELGRVAADISRDQPEGSYINVSSQDLAAISRVVMLVQVVGGDDPNALRDLVEERMRPHLLAVPGVSQVIATGGAARGITVWADPERVTAMGLGMEQVTAALGRAVRRLGFAGGLENEAGRLPVMVDGRPRTVGALGEIRIDPDRPVLLRHVAEIEMGTQRRESEFRINGEPAVGLVVFQEEGENLVQLGRNVRARLERLEDEFGPYGLDLVVGFDAAETVETQLDRLKWLALSGFIIALIVLYLFLKEWRAVAVVAVAVPVSLLAAGALLYLGGWTLNLITLFGLAIGIGILVDNSIVVYEAVQRGLERGAPPADAAANGIRRTLRAIIASCATTAVVFLPGIYVTDNPLTRELVILLAVTIVVPLAASLLVATALVPLLARQLAAPGAVARIARAAEQRQAFAGLEPPQRMREMSTGLLKVALRNPVPWLGGVTAAVLVTVVVAIPWVLVSTFSQQPREADQVQVEVAFTASRSLDAAGEIFTRLEQAALALDGVERVESSFDESEGTLTVHLVAFGERPEGAGAGRVRAVVERAVQDVAGVSLSRTSALGSGAGGNDVQRLFGGGDSEVVLSGPSMTQLGRMATETMNRLESIPEVGSVSVSRLAGRDELHVRPDLVALADYGINPEEVFGALGVLSREGVPLEVGFVLDDGREIPIHVRRPEPAESGGLPLVPMLQELRLASGERIVPTGVVASIQKRLPPPVIVHKNGRRELAVSYQLSENAPGSGPARARLEAEIQSAVRAAHRPAGYAVEATGAAESRDWFRSFALPALILLYAVLAVAFESATLPVLVLLAVPLTILGATWALVIAGVPADLMALMGAVTLLGLTVNPAILLVDRMQSRLRSGGVAGAAAAMAAVRERTRPVLMTSCTTIAGLWPLAVATGREFEIWPPFATVVIGGLVTSTLLTLLVIPVGFVFLSRVDRLFGRTGPWLLLTWLGLTGGGAYALSAAELVTSLGWQVTTTLMIGAALLALVAYRRRPATAPVPAADMRVDVRYLTKVYGAPGPIRKAWLRGTDFAASVLARGGNPVSTERAREQALACVLLLVAAVYLAASLQTVFWRLVFAFAGVALFNAATAHLQRWLGDSDPAGRVRNDGVFGKLRFAAPWLTLAAFTVMLTVRPLAAGEHFELAPIFVVMVALLIAVVQVGRRTATRVAGGKTPATVEFGWMHRLRTVWRGFACRLFGLDLPRDQVEALRGVTFTMAPGMIGILGPNGAGKTTLLRLLAGMLTPSAGTIRYGGVRLGRLRARLANWVGYLPQEFGLPEHLTAREYLDYFAHLYGVGSGGDRAQRVQTLLAEVGLAERADERIGSFSGGMKQRVGVARALLRQPDVIIVDEPTVGLDPRERIRFRNLLARLAADRVVMFSTHVVEDVAVSCDRVLVMRRGQLVYDGAPAALSEECRGKVWEFVAADGEASLPPEAEAGAYVIDRIPEPDGRVRVRILAPRQPRPDATPGEPTLEDGYLSLVAFAGSL